MRGERGKAGAIVAARVVPGDRDRAEREQITLLLDSGDLRVFDLAGAVAIRFTDARLQTQLRDDLAALTASRSKERRSPHIDSTDAKGRGVRVSMGTAGGGARVTPARVVGAVGRG